MLHVVFVRACPTCCKWIHVLTAAGQVGWGGDGWGKVMQVSTEGRQRNGTPMQQPHVLEFGVGAASKQ